MDNSLGDAVQTVIMNSSNQIRIMPSWVALGAYKILDPDGLSPDLVRFAALQTLTQIARQQLRGTFESADDPGEEQHSLFPGLQRRYPIARKRRDEEPIYVNLEELSEADVEWNINRLQKESTAKQQHANRLRTWWASWFHGKQKAA